MDDLTTQSRDYKISNWTGTLRIGSSTLRFCNLDFGLSDRPFSRFFSFHPALSYSAAMVKTSRYPDSVSADTLAYQACHSGLGIRVFAAFSKSLSVSNVFSNT